MDDRPVIEVKFAKPPKGIGAPPDWRPWMIPVAIAVIVLALTAAMVAQVGG